MNCVLALHEVTGAAWLDGVIRWLRQRYRLLSAEYVSELLAGGDVRNACHITVDDGHRSFQDIIFPVLKQHRVPSTLFVSPRICTQRSRFWFQELRQCDEATIRDAAAAVLNVPQGSLAEFSVASICKALPLRKIESILQTCRPAAGPAAPENVTAEQLRALAATGLVTIGAHTLSHPILSNETDARSEEEIVRSVSELSSLVEREVRYFAYPNGLPGIDFTEREERYLAKAGVDLAFSTESRALKPTDDRFRVPRIQISSNESLGRIRAKLKWPGAWNMLKRMRSHGEYAERNRLNRLICTIPRGR